MLKDAPEKKVGNSTTTVSSLLKEIMTDLNPRLDDATQKRLEVLANLGKERRNMELRPLLKAVGRIIHDSLTNDFAVKKVNHYPNGEEWYRIIEEIRSSGFAVEINNVLSYPVVKEEIQLAMNNFEGDIKELADLVLEKLVSSIFWRYYDYYNSFKLIFIIICKIH